MWLREGGQQVREKKGEGAGGRVKGDLFALSKIKKGWFWETL